jgi:hypothetical protein
VLPLLGIDPSPLPYLGRAREVSPSSVIDDLEQRLRMRLAAAAQ